MNKNGKILLDKISELDPELITNADKKPLRKSKIIIGITSGLGTMAAAAAIAVAAAKIAPPQAPLIYDPIDVTSTSSGTGTSDTSSAAGTYSSAASSAQSTTGIPTGGGDPVSVPVTAPPDDPPQLDFSKYKDLPKISDKDYGVRGAGGGNEASAWGLYSWQLENNSPWNGEELETMPVYMSCSTEKPDLEKMYARVREVAAALGIPEDELEITDNYYPVIGLLDKHREAAEEQGASEEEIEEMLNRMMRSTMSMVEVTGKADGVKIWINAAYKVGIYFEGENRLPDGYKYNRPSDKERAELLNYLTERYKELTGYSKPAQSRDEGGRDLIYDADGDLTEQIVNYWLNYTTFSIDEYNGKLWQINMCTDGALKKLADYPVLTVSQAEAILKSNRYGDDERMPADAKVLKTELYYGNAAGYTAVMPYYRFYTESGNDNTGDFEVLCDVYTIAAVPEEFIDMETTDYGVRA